MNLLDMQNEWMDTFGFGDGTDPNEPTINRFKRFANIAYSEIMGKKGLSSLRRRFAVPFSTVSGVKSAVIPIAASRIITIFDKDNNRLLDPMELQDLRYDDPGEVMTASTPYGYTIENLAAPIARDPSAAAELFVKSTSANDGSGVTVYFQGVVTGGYPKPADITLNGVTAVSLDPLTTSWIFGRKYYLSSVCRGDIVLTQTSGAGTELARIPAGRRVSRYTRVLIHPTPSSAITLYADVELALEQLINEADEPLIPDDYQWVVTSGAMAREWAKRREPTMYTIERNRYIDGIRELKLFMQRPSGVPANRSLGRRFSQLGSYYPSGS